MGETTEADGGPLRDPGPRTAVLVHGAWHDERCWVDLTPELALRRMSWHYLTLPSSNPRADRPGLADDVRAVNALLDSLAHDVTLVGHGYGGMVIGEAGHHPTVSRLVYLAGICADYGETADEHLLGLAPSRASLVIESDEDLTWVKPGIGGRALYGDLERAEAEEKAKLLQPWSGQSLLDPAGVPAWKTKPTTYVVCAKDRFLPPGRQKKMAARATPDIVTLRSGHAPFFSSPSDVAAVIARRPAERKQPSNRHQDANEHA